MPIELAVLFLISTLFSAFLLGVTFSLKTKYKNHFLDAYFYYVISLVCYGLVNWIGPSLVIFFDQTATQEANSSIVLFIAVAIPLAFLKLYLFFTFLGKLINQKSSNKLVQLYSATSLIVIISAIYFLINDFGSSALASSSPYLTIIGIGVLVLTILALFYFLSKCETIEHIEFQRQSRLLGWSYLIGYAVYAAPYYLSYFIHLSWYLALSPYIYYLMHLVPLYFVWRIAQLPCSPNDTEIVIPNNFESVIKRFEISNREQVVLELILKGKNNQQIADQLCISPNTVRNHIYNIYGKTRVKNRIQLRGLFDQSV